MIRHRPSAASVPPRRLPAALAPLLGLVLSAGVLSGCGDGDPSADRGPTAPRTPAASSSSPAPETRTSPGAGPSASAGEEGRRPPRSGKRAPRLTSRRSGATPSTTVQVPVYFVGDTPDGPRLYREVRAVGAKDPLTAAARLATGAALDPDYRTLLPEGAVRRVGFEGFGRSGVYTVTLSDAGTSERPAGMSRREAGLAAQQLVRTLQAAGRSRSRVVFRVRGEEVPFLGLRREQGFAAATALDVLALANVVSPAQGATVRGSFTARGVASSFEATVPWELRRRSRVVRSGFATAQGWMDRLHPWRTEVDVTGLRPGRYTFVAMTASPSGEGAGATRDTKTVLVR